MGNIIVKGLFAGKVAQQFGMTTAMVKSPVLGRIFVSEQGLEGDEVAEKRFHGGPERAIHQYPFEHYSYWKQRYSIDQEWLAPGMGENISSLGMTEESVCIGDQYQWGEAVIEVSQPRSPCFKLGKRWGVEDLSVHMQEISRCGWLYRVIKTGHVSSQDALILMDRDPEALSVKQVCDLYFGDPLNSQGLARLLALKGLSQSWRSTIEKRIETQQVENWNFRLLGHP